MKKAITFFIAFLLTIIGMGSVVVFYKTDGLIQLPAYLLGLSLGAIPLLIYWVEKVQGWLK